MGVVGPGVPGWVDFGTPDIEASAAFYRGLFGWDAKASSPEFGGYTIFTLDGKAVAGGCPLMSPEQPPVWSTYVTVEDAAATTLRIGPAGGRVLVEPMAVADQGTMAVYLDPDGAAIGVWQPGAMSGGEVFNDPGALTWNELVTKDLEAAKAFYGTVFGWETTESVLGDVTHVQWELDGTGVAGMSALVGERWPTDVGPHWSVYFSVADCDYSAERVTELDGTVLVPPTDMPPGGRFARAMDPGGAQFIVISISE
jgi:predicted enzyme related to lactoylglutathione lyase